MLVKVAVVLLIAFVVLAGLGLLFSARPTPVTGVDASSLAHSVKSNGSYCSEIDGGNWDCAIELDRGTTHYTVEVGWDGCWDANRTKGPVARNTPESKTGCVDIWDHLVLEDIFN
ncbi:MAG: hypothetical protein ACSLFD_07240 [Solirubrobacterales bacterium]